MRDYSVEWAAVYAAAYVDARRRHEVEAGDSPGDHAALARDSAQVADEAVRALHRVRGGGEP